MHIIVTQKNTKKTTKQNIIYIYREGRGRWVSEHVSTNLRGPTPPDGHKGRRFDKK